MIHKHLKDSWYKYLLEIAVVVLGILIAFSLENWRDSIDKQKTEINALKEISSGLKRLSHEAFINLRDEKNALAACDYILHNFEHNLGLTDSLKFALNTAWRYTYLEPDYGPYEFVKNYGASIIENDSLRKEVLQLYGQDIKATVGESRIRGEYVERVRMLMPKWYESYSNIPFTNIKQEMQSLPHHYDSLKSDKSFLFHIKTQKEYCKWYSFELNGLKNFADELEQKVTEEIKKLE